MTEKIIILDGFILDTTDDSVGLEQDKTAMSEFIFRPTGVGEPVVTESGVTIAPGSVNFYAGWLASARNVIITNPNTK